MQHDEKLTDLAKGESLEAIGIITVLSGEINLIATETAIERIRRIKAARNTAQIIQQKQREKEYKR